MFSARLPHELTPNTLSTRLAELGANGVRVLDLTQSNPTAVGLAYPAALASSLASTRVDRYDPRPFGIDEARRVVAATYADRGHVIAPAQIALTSSTSEAYAFLFKLLCDPGDAVLVPQPSYPLFELLSGLEGIRADPYRLNIHDAWSIDRATLERALTTSTRAILVVSPNNPTGSMLDVSDREWLARLAADRGVALISDEVFMDYPLKPRARATSLLGETRALTFTLGGLSKSAALPQMKLAWIVTSGPDVLRRQALQRLEVIADTYLSVSTPVQLAAAALIGAGAEIRHAVRARLSQNLEWLRTHLRSHASLTLLEPEGGWTVVLRIPATDSEENVVLRLLDEAHVLVHPGYFFDFDEDAFLVVSLLPEPGIFQEGISRLASVVTGARA